MSTTPTQRFDAPAELAQVKALRITARKQAYRPSKLDKHRAELVELRKAGASYADLVTWLRTQRRMKVAHTTVMRYLKGLPECRHG